MKELYSKIKSDPQIWKFCFYGFFKNLKFFEPYLYIYFLSLGFSLFYIGILYSIREAAVYIIEIPTGIFADNYGKKKSLLICFTSYIISFVIFFFTTNFLVAAIGMIMFAIGEAFRSGTHKAMIYYYLEQKGWFSEKTFVYGRTRSFSLLGSSLAAFTSILFVLNIPAMKWIFIISIVPYILDFLLILSYPDSLDQITETDMSIKRFMTSTVEKMKSIFGNIFLTKVLISSSLYDGIFSTVKDYIQPLMKGLIIASGLILIKTLPQKSNVKIMLGIIYGVFYIFSSSASRNVFRLNKFVNSFSLMNLMFDIMGVIFVLLFFIIRMDMIWIVILLYFFLYLMKDARRPLVVDVCGDNMNKNERATVMSVDDQFKSIFMIVLAPLFGFISDKFSIAAAFLIFGVFILIVNLFIKGGWRIKKPELRKVTFDNNGE